MNAKINSQIFTQPVLLAIIAGALSIATMVNGYFIAKLDKKTEVAITKTEVAITKVDTVERKTNEIIAKVDTLHNTVNGKMRQLLELTETSAKAEGKLEQKQEQDSIEKK